MKSIMTCSDARAAMRVADRRALRGADDSDLAGHLRACDACRSLAAGIESDTALLASALAARGSVDAERVIAPPRLGTRTAAILFAALPVAATIVLGVLLHRQGTPRGAPREVRDVIASNMVSVDVERGQTTTVIRTKDPTVTIVWISPGGTQ